MYTSCKIWKNHWNTSFKDHTLFSFLADFQWNILGNSININDLRCNPEVLKKKVGKTSKKLFFGALFAQKWGHYGPRPKWRIIFLSRNNKSRSSAFTKFFIYQNIMFWLNYLEWCFLLKKCHFQLKQFVIFKPFSYCFKETIKFDVKVSFACRPLSRLIRWINKAGDIKK